MRSRGRRLEWAAPKPDSQFHPIALAPDRAAATRRGVGKALLKGASSRPMPKSWPTSSEPGPRPRTIAGSACGKATAGTTSSEPPRMANRRRSSPTPSPTVPWRRRSGGTGGYGVRRLPPVMRGPGENWVSEPIS